jgi:hypothetical protein
MNAAEVIEATHAIGLIVRAKGSKLVLEATTPPPETILQDLRRLKSEILALLQVEPSSWSRDDWKAYFDERAGIMQFDGGFRRAEAELCAFEDCVEHWLALHPHSAVQADCCVQCQTLVTGGVSIRLAEGGLLHQDCAAKWKVSRRIHARRQLSWLLDIVAGAKNAIRGDRRNEGQPHGLSPDFEIAKPPASETPIDGSTETLQSNPT